MRLDGWEVRLFEVLRDHEARPFSWGGVTGGRPDGGSDCHMLAMDACRAVTGIDPYPDERGRYATRIGALRLFSARGFRWLDDAYAAVFERVPPMLAQRGDIGLVSCDGADCACVVVGAEAIGKSPGGTIRVPVAALRTAFRVG